MARPISDKYSRRLAACKRETLLLRSKGRGVMKQALQETTEEQLYNRTPLKVSRAMFQSIKTRFVLGGVEVYYDAQVAPHAARRLNEKGISPSGGHLLDMQPSLGVRLRADPKLRILVRLAQRKITS